VPRQPSHLVYFSFMTLTTVGFGDIRPVTPAFEAGALASVATAATFSGFMHFIRIFGGQIGVAAMTHFITVCEKFHSNLLGLNVGV